VRLLDDLQQQPVFRFSGGLGLRQCTLNVPLQARNGLIRGRLPSCRQLSNFACAFRDELQL